MQYDPVTTVVNHILENGGKARRQGKEYKATCPAHEDGKSSLQVGAGEKGAVVHCHAGCKPDDILAALNMTTEQLFNDYGEPPAQDSGLRRDLHQAASGALATYFYEDENGAVLFRVERHRDKKFIQARPDPVNPGAWLYTLGSVRRVPFHLPNVKGAVKEGEPVFVVEGEKDVLNLERHGVVATCNPGGAGKFKREFGEFFTGAHVVVVPDNDEPGRKHADEVASVLRDVARSVKILLLPDLPEKGDVSDWLHADKDNDGEKLRALAEAVEPKYTNRPQIFSAAELMKEQFADIVMAVPGLIAEGLTFLVGAPKIGKSWMSLGLGLSVATGNMALGTIPVEQGPVLYLALEDTPRRLQRRLNVMLGGNIGGIEDVEGPEDFHFATNWPRLGAGGLDQLEEWLKANPNARMVIIDTWAKVKSAVADSVHGTMYDSDYSAVSAVKNLADEYSTAIVFIHHQRKAQDNDPLNTVAGSTGLTGAADATVVLTRPRGAEEGHLYVTGRDVEESRSIVSFDPEAGAWLYLGEADKVEESRTEDTVIALLTEEAKSGDGPIGPKELAQRLDLKDGTAKWLLSKLATEGKIIRVGRGKYTSKSADTAKIQGGGGTIIAPIGPGGITVTAPTPSMIPGMPDDGTASQFLSDDDIDKLMSDDDGYGDLDDDDDDSDG